MAVAAIVVGVVAYAASPVSAQTRASACRVLDCDLLSPQIGRHLVIQELGDAVDVILQRMGDGCSSYDECYAKRGMGIGSIYWRGGHRGREEHDKFWYGNGGDGRVAGISARAEEDFGRDNGAASLEFCTAAAGKQNAECAKRMIVESDGCITITERGAVRVDASTPYVHLCVENGALVVRQRAGAVTPIGKAVEAAALAAPTPAPTPARVACTYREGRGFRDGWYAADGSLLRSGDRSSPPPRECAEARDSKQVR